MSSLLLNILITGIAVAFFIGTLIGLFWGAVMALDGAEEGNTAKTILGIGIVLVVLLWAWKRT